MDILKLKDVRLMNRYGACRCLSLLFIALVLRAIFLPIFPASQQNSSFAYISSLLTPENRIRRDKFLEVPQIVWGLNNQKIAFARACLTARMLNRTLLMPNLSASLFYKEVDRLLPISFDKVFKFEEFNSRCQGFVRLGKLTEVSNKTKVFEAQKGSGRKWTLERDMVQLRELIEERIDRFDLIRIVGKNPFLWQDHWPVQDYAKVFECLVLVDEIAEEAERVVSKIREVGSKFRNNANANANANAIESVPYVAVHMRIEIDWMIHCKKLEQRWNISQICSSKQEIMKHVGHSVGFEYPTVVYLAVADSLLDDPSLLNGWRDGLVPFEKKKLGVWDIYSKYPYLIQSAIDYEVCSRADIFVGNSYSTFSSLVVLGRTQKLIRMGVTSSCDMDVRWPSYAYNILGGDGGPQKWMTDMSRPSLQDISYGSNNITC